jgi:hypothetical protein
MSSFPAVDVALGLILVYFLLSIVCSAVNEMIASALGWRARDLEKGIRQLLRAHEENFREHPLIKTLLDPDRRRKAERQAIELIRSKKLEGRVDELIERDDIPPDKARTRLLAQRGLQTRTVAYPSYIPSRTFVAALLGYGYEGGKQMLENPRSIVESIDALPDGEVKEAMLALYHHAQGNAVEFRKAAERWYDDTMERVSGWYRRRVQRVLFVLAAVIVLAINADSLQIAKHLWTNPAAQEAVANAAASATGDESGKEALKELRALPLPLGWHFSDREHDPQGIPFYQKDTSVMDAGSKLIGLLLTTFALMLGAPFWFDTLSKIARLRNSGAPPPASDAVRHGEGEETRRGTTTLLVQPAPEERSRAAPEGVPGAGT